MISDTNPTPFTGDVSINCGSTEASAARNGRQWVGDGQPKLCSLLQLKGLSAASTATDHKVTSADPVPHKTARLSRSPFSYVFQVNPGQKIIRLHFNHISYRGFQGSKDLFSVEAAPFTLLANFSASLTAVALGVSTFTKEFVLTIQESQLLTLTFSPESSPSQDTHAFINGIEFIPVPSCLSYFGRGDVGLQVVGQKSKVYVDNSTALEIVHRLNIKEDLVKPTGDFYGIFPKWATQRADKMHNRTWKMPVDVGFRYLIRLHFSEMGLKKASTGDAMFKVLINEMVACSNTELVKQERENHILLYMDYLVVMRGHKHEGKRDILISFQSYDDGDGLLAGFEILKLSNPDDSLASPNPLPLLQGSSSQTNIQIFPSVIGHRNASGTVVVIVISLLSIIVHKLREIREARSIDEHKPSARAERVCRRFSLAEIQLATRNFSDGLLIGRGGFGKVYKGLIDKGQMTVAVKRLKSNSQQGASEFLTEVEVLSELRHINVISLIGYCNEQKEKILVYEYMPRGTLADHLYKYARDNRNYSSLTWKQRLNICIGAARGLDYLHTGHRVIHRDVKASNILLDESFIPKLSDFGLAKHENEGEFQSHVSTKVKGTNGYLDPHYFQTCKLTRKSDTYALGVVLLGTVCGRPAVDLWVPEDERILTKWAQDKISKGEVDQIVASSLKEEMSSNSLKAFVEIAERCLHDEPKNRPTMSQIVLQLEFALEQQDTNLNQEIKEKASAYDEPLPTSSDGTSIDMQNPTLPPNRQILTKVGNSELTSGKKQGRTPTRSSPSRLRPWDAFWNRVKPSKKNALPLSETPKMEARKEEEYREAGREFSNRIEPSQKNQLASLDTAKMEARKEEEFQEADITSSNRVETSKKNQLTLPDTAKMEARREEKFREADVPLASILDKEKLSKFDQHIIVTAWNQFSCSNNDGEGRFGSVYKVVLPSGQLAAVKRVSESSYTGFDECYNEILLLYSLQHQNIIKLLGHFCHKRYKFLVYEFMENTGLDSFIDKEKENLLWLLWPVRFKIITGIARGLVYLHQDSELRVIHRDLKLRNILLDSEMNPKISHFANARSLVESRSEYGKYCSMPPECPRRGRLSVKPDVYSFGIIVLEILTGTRAWKPEHTMTIRNYAQNLWDEEKALDLVDNSVGAFSADEALRCIQAALLCTQWDPDQRPAMPSVLQLLNGDKLPHESQELSFSIWRSNSLSLGHQKVAI